MNLIALISFVFVGFFFLQESHNARNKNRNRSVNGCKSSDCLDRSPTGFRESKQLKIRLLNTEGSSTSALGGINRFGTIDSNPGHGGQT